MKIFFIMMIFSLTVLDASARCSGTYADHLIKNRYDCGSADGNSNLVVALHQNAQYSQAFESVAGVCMSGCYDALFNVSLKPECDAKYAVALSQVNFVVPTTCKDRGAYIKLDSDKEKCACYYDEILKTQVCPKCIPSSFFANTSSAVKKRKTADDVCYWSSRQTLEMNCGQPTGATKPERNLCGAGGRSICSGSVTCTEKFDQKNPGMFDKLVERPAGEYAISCLSKSGSCDDKGRGPRISECMSDPSVDISVKGKEEVLIQKGSAVDSATEK
jgi:hypothetical protein